MKKTSLTMVRYTAAGFLAILLMALAIAIALWSLSASAWFLAAKTSYDPAREIKTQRYLQFSGQPGILLYGFREERSPGNQVGSMIPAWSLEFRSLLNHEIQAREQYKTTREAQNKPALRFGIATSTHGEKEGDFYAVYRYFSLAHLCILLSAVTICLVGLIAWDIRRPRRERTAASP